MREDQIHAAIKILRREIRQWQEPVVGVVARESARDPFRILISCLLSLRTKDKTTSEASARLFALAHTPAALLKLSQRSIERAIYPVGFYRKKAKAIHAICRRLLAVYEGKVPQSIDELMTLAGVGRKTANLVVTVGYQKPGICVDTHVHRISNRWGYVKTKTPEQTEAALRSKLPKPYWIEYHDLLVRLGHHLCRPISPLCSQCPVKKFCSQINVTVRR